MIRIGISSGHNADNVNASPDKTAVEWKINLAIKKKVEILLKINNFKFVDMNPERMNYSLQQRADIANNRGVSAVVAIHCNALKGYWGNWGGIETFAHPQAPEKGGKLLAKKIHSYLIQGTPLINRGVKFGEYAILAMTKAPAVLVELGFLDNRREATLLLSESYQQECAIEIVKGLCDYFKKSFKSSDIEDFKGKYLNLKKVYEQLVLQNEKDSKILKKVKTYIDNQVKEMDFVSRKYFEKD